MTAVFSKVAIANRGEISVRITRTLRRLGIVSVALYSDADTNALHVKIADEARRLGPAPSRDSYLNVGRVVDAAVSAGADALHPGYGFLSESPALVEACAAAGITFIGPTADAIEAMGDKIRARNTVAAAGVPVVPGRSGAGLSDEELAEAALDVGLPVLLKPSAGGGGKGMRLVTDPSHLAAEIAASRREALGAFGDDTLLVERFVNRPRHIELQVAADIHGNVVHLGERECSLQRRHQKIIEESPSPFVTPELREAMGQQAITVAEVCGYTNVGTVEFVVSGERADEFFFMEMNTRLQVEHPVTEATYGVDLVEQQLRIAAGERLPWTQNQLVPHGHAIEARVYAEDPVNGFLPTGGRIQFLREPSGDGIRVDAGWQTGTNVDTSYDPMLAKVIAWAETRTLALDRLRAALADTTVLGVTTNIEFLHDLLYVEAVRTGQLHTGIVEDTPTTPPAVPRQIVTAAWLHTRADHSSDPWNRRIGWRLGAPAEQLDTLQINGERFDIRAHWTKDGWLIAIGDEPLSPATQPADLDVVDDKNDTTWLGLGGRTWQTRILDRTRAVAATTSTPGKGEVTSPMPGTVTAVYVASGDQVTAGQPVATVEAMKMEHTLKSTIDGLVTAVHAKAGDQVAIRQPLVSIETIQEGEVSPK